MSNICENCGCDKSLTNDKTCPICATVSNSRLIDGLCCGIVKIAGAKYGKPSTFTMWDASKMGDVEDGDYEIFIRVK